MVGQGQGTLHPFKVAEMSLGMLEKLASIQPAVDRATKEVLSPLPRVHTKLANYRCLPHIAQLILTGDSPHINVAQPILVLQ
jgi:DnaJ family protein C protein 13